MRKNILLIALAAASTLANAQTAAPAEDKEKKAEFVDQLFSE